MMINSLAAMPIHELKRAIAIREQIDSLTAELDKLTAAHNFLGTNVAQLGKQRGPTANGVHWTGHNGIVHRANTGVMAKKARLSPEGRAKVSAAVRARWERFRAAKARAARTK